MYFTKKELKYCNKCAKFFCCKGNCKHFTKEINNPNNEQINFIKKKKESLKKQIEINDYLIKTFDIIIETYQRIEMLRFLQTMIDKEIITEDITISASNYFFLNKKNGKQEKISTIKNSTFAITPNFENSQKIGVLLKYKEGFFSSYFQEKLIVLCSIGLIFFDDDYKNGTNYLSVMKDNLSVLSECLN